MLSCTWFLIVSKKIFVGDERNTYSKCSMVYISREKEGKKDCRRRKDNLSEPATRRNAIDYDLWRGVAGRTISVCLVIRKI